MAVVSSITQFAPEPLRLDRYRNELASDMLTLPASKANTAGLLLLRRLAATAPDPESDVVFLPQLRAINVMKTCQQWISSDEDIDEEVDCAMTLIFLHLAPILQNVPGAHWEFIFDVIETNLEVRSHIGLANFIV
jgi:E3 ubiquitin-protein ligase listerin